MCWGHLPWNGKCGCHFLGIRSTTIYKCQNWYRYRTRFQNFVRTLWRFILQHHGCSSKPECGLSLEEVAQPPLCAARSPAGMLAGRSLARSWWEAGVALQVHTSLCSCHWDAAAARPPRRQLPLFSLSGKRGWNYSIAALPQRQAAAFVYWWGGLLLGQKVSAFHQLPGWYLFLCFSYS